MKSNSFSKYRQLRAQTKALQKDLKRIKKTRNDRRRSRVILKKFHSSERLIYKIKCNSGAWEIL